ncbi:MAG: hypothetical protein EOS23_32675 [Mesorhizobium sp.]|nr:MAG: hypothetical protein EOQ56_35430 [Mesorhizobium sp.]RWE05844.1 MAG: hypothetical protein EOS23_32675 [Mesorhizobium sp.]
MNNDREALQGHLAARTLAYANHIGLQNITITYLYLQEADFRRCIADRNFARITDYQWAAKNPIYGPIGPYYWFLAVPSEFPSNFPNIQALRNAADFPVIAWGKVYMGY